MKRPIRPIVALAMLCMLAAAREARAYSVLTHEAIVDSVWARSIVPLLRARYRVSDDELRRARAFAYGGCVIQDIGYYPFASRFFGDLTHYVRSGDFVAALVRDAADVNEYAFALGTLAHYAADNNGHPLAVNRAVPLEYPKLRARYGDEITYAQSPSAHLKTEFGFDVLQVARGQYVSDAYHDFIGFEVSIPALDRAFKSTYGLDLKDVFKTLDLSIGTFRWTVSTMMPEATKIAWELKHDEIAALTPGITRERFAFGLTRAEYEKKYGVKYERPGFRHKLLALLLRIVPKLGPFKPLAFEPPTPEAERLFLASFTTTVERYAGLIDAAARDRLTIENRNFDTGRPVKAGDYPLVDEAYARLVRTLAERHFQAVPAALRANVLAFYADLNTQSEPKMNGKERRRLQQDLVKLKGS